MGVGIGAGNANRAEAQRQADELRAHPGTAVRWERQQWARLAIAFVPLRVHDRLVRAI
jgi:hypothetical protein